MNILNTLTSVATASTILINALGLNPGINSNTLAEHEMSLTNRYPEKSVNEVFKDNILLTMAYMEKKVTDPKSINWDDVEKYSDYDFVLEPNQTFSFHDDVLKDYEGNVAKTTNAHFNAQEGFKSDGYLFGDGVCHLASLMYWVAKDAKLDAIAPTSHDFHEIPGIEKQYGVSIYSMPGQKNTNAQQNLYIKNTKEKPVVFHFEHDEEKVKLSIKTLH